MLNENIKSNKRRRATRIYELLFCDEKTKINLLNHGLKSVPNKVFIA